MVKRNSPIMRIATIALALCLIMSCAVFGSVAKYTSSATASDKATVASWKITLNNIDLNAEDATQQFEANFDLFGLPNTNVAQTNGLIAPGCSGSFTFNLVNAGQVTAEYTIKLEAEVTNGGAPIQYSLNGVDGWVDDIGELVIKGELGHTENKTAEKTVYWRWNTTSDSDDTVFGVNAQTAPGTITITAAAEVNQKQ